MGNKILEPKIEIIEAEKILKFEAFFTWVSGSYVRLRIPWSTLSFKEGHPIRILLVFNFNFVS